MRHTDDGQNAKNAKQLRILFWSSLKLPGIICKLPCLSAAKGISFLTFGNNVCYWDELVWYLPCNRGTFTKCVVVWILL